MTMLHETKIALRITTDAYDSEINSLIEAGHSDLALCGIVPDCSNALVKRAIITYVRCNFGTPEDYDSIKASYDEQKKQLQTSRLYRMGDDYR